MASVGLATMDAQHIACLPNSQARNIKIVALSWEVFQHPCIVAGEREIPA